MAANVFEFGIAIDFLGNYARESVNLKNKFKDITQTLNSFASNAQGKMGGFLRSTGNAFMSFGKGLGNAFDKVDQGINNVLGSLFNLKSLIIGGALGAAFKQLSDQIMGVGMQLETQYARMFTAMKSQQRVIETMEWAKKAAVETPFDLREINEFITTLTVMGKGKSLDKLSETFTSLGDFAAAYGQSLQSGGMALLMASFGNWRRLILNFGIYKENITQMAEDFPQYNDELRANREELIKLAKVMGTAKAGTDEYADAVIKFFGIYTKGGMQRLVQTVGGALSNIQDLWSNFMISIVGFSQQNGSFFSQVSKSLGENAGGFLGIFNQVVGLRELNAGDQRNLTMLKQQGHIVEQTNGHLMHQVYLKDRLFRVGRELGQMLIFMWGTVDDAIQGVGNRIANLVNRLDAFFGDFKNNVAPLLVAFTIIKLNIMDFFRGLKNGFTNTIGPIWEGIKMFVGFLSEVFAKILGNSDMSKWEKLGQLMGSAAALMIGFKAVKFVISPFRTLLTLLTGIAGQIGGITRGVGGMQGGAGISASGIAGGIGAGAGALGGGWFGSKIGEQIGDYFGNALAGKLTGGSIGALLGGMVGKSIVTALTAAGPMGWAALLAGALVGGIIAYLTSKNEQIKQNVREGLARQEAESFGDSFAEYASDKGRYEAYGKAGAEAYHAKRTADEKMSTMDRGIQVGPNAAQLDQLTKILEETNKTNKELRETLDDNKRVMQTLQIDFSEFNPNGSMR